MDPPKNDKLDRILAIYGGIKQKSFYERVRDYKQKLSERDVLLESVHRLNDAQVKMASSFIKSLLDQENT